MTEFTHDQLNEIAQRWLLRAHSAKGPGCNVAFTEVGGMFHGERADAWGYRLFGNSCPGSFLVEVKISRSDFLADAKKPHRNGKKLGMGNYRYYLCPEGLLYPDDLPEKWGLIWVNSRGHCKVLSGHQKSMYSCGSDEFQALWFHESNTELELSVLAHLIKRLGDPEKLNRDFKLAHLEANRLRKKCDEQAERMRGMITMDFAKSYIKEQVILELREMAEADGVNVHTDHKTHQLELLDRYEELQAEAVA